MRSPLLVFVFTSAALCQTPSENPQLASSKAFYDQVKGTVLKSVDKMPEDKYSYRPSDDVRTYGQLLAHIADGQFFLCSIAKDGKPAPRGIEKSVKTKAEILKALNDGFAYCDELYAALTDASAAATVSWFGQQRTKLSMLAFNTAHTMEHYGNLVTYMRINKIVPPSSENTAPAKPKPPQ